MEKTKRQHYVPRMYLKRFGYKIKNMDKISVLKVNESQILEKQGVENFAISNYFYDVSKEELENIVKETFLLYPELKNSKSLEDDQFVEHALARKEAVINQLLDGLEDDLGIIYKTENRARFVDFLHSMAYRTKSFRDKMGVSNCNSSAEKEELLPSVLVKSDVEEVENVPSMNLSYDFWVDTVVYIGMDAYEVVTLSEDAVVLRNQMYPLFTEEMPRQEFERKVGENPANDHLKKNIEMPEVEELQEEQKAEQDIEVKDGIVHRNYLSLMELAPEVLRGERDSMEFYAGEHFMPLTVEWAGEYWLSMSHYFEQNGDSLPDPDKEFMVDHEKQELHARTYDSAY